MALALGGESVLYVATAQASRDPDLQRRVRRHRERRPAGWGTLELGGGDPGQVLEAAENWRAVLLDSLTLWVSARMLEGEGEEGIQERFDRFLEGASAQHLAGRLRVTVVRGTRTVFRGESNLAGLEHGAG